MTEQQQHLKTCRENLQKVTAEIRELEAQTLQRRDMALKLQGIIEYLTGTGVTLDEEESAQESAPPEEVKASSLKAKTA